MEKLKDINEKTLKVFNTLYLFETILINEILNTKNIRHEDFVNESINIDFIYEVFDEIWSFCNSYKYDQLLVENMIYDVLNDKITLNEHKDIILFFLSKNENLEFDIDYKLLEEIKNYVVNLTHEYGNKIKISSLLRNYNIFFKTDRLSKYKYETLLCEENFCFN